MNYLRSHLYTYDSRLPELAWESMAPEGWIAIPRLIAVPLLLSAGALLSKLLFSQLERNQHKHLIQSCLLYTSPSPRDKRQSRMPSSA